MKVGIGGEEDMNTKSHAYISGNTRVRVNSESSQEYDAKVVMISVGIQESE